MNSMREKTEALRVEALAALQESESFQAFRALDDAVAAMGGKRLMSSPSSVTINGAPLSVHRVLVEQARQRVSQAEAAELVLVEEGRPMTGAELLAAVPAKGCVVGGAKPLMSFGSTLSRDPRFVNFRRDGQYYWWLKAKPLPASTNEASDLPLQAGSDASGSYFSQGGNHAAAMT